MKKKNKTPRKLKKKRNKVYSRAHAQSKHEPKKNVKLSNVNTENLLPAFDLSYMNPILGLQRQLTELNRHSSFLSKISAPTSPFINLYSNDFFKNQPSTHFPSNWIEAFKLELAIPNPMDWTDIFNLTKSASSILESKGFPSNFLGGLATNPANLSYYANKSITSFPWSEFGSQLKLETDLKFNLSSSFLSFTNDFSRLFESFVADPNSYLDLETLVTKSASIEYYNSADIIESISTQEELSLEESKLNKEIIYENEFTLIEYLPKIHPKLLNMWKGAIETLNMPNSDGVRQFTVSLRELFTHVFHILAPEDKIRDWSTSPQDFYDGKATRSARIKYICRNISKEPLNAFVDKDVKSTLELVDIFQKATHGLDFEPTPHQIRAIRAKSESALKFLIEIEFTTNR
jgi:hypothetical protein